MPDHTRRLRARHVFLIAVPLLLVVILIVGLLQPSAQPSVTSTSRPTTSSQPTIHPSTLEATEKDNSLSVSTDGLDDRVFLVEEALSLPPGSERDRLLISISTPEGFKTARLSPSGLQSSAEKGSNGATFRVVRDCPDNRCFQPEVLDATTLSVASQIPVDSYRGETLLNRFTSKRITMWVKQDNTWKFAGEQPAS